MKTRIFILSLLIAVMGCTASIEVQATPATSAATKVKMHVYNELSAFERVSINIPVQVLVEQSDCYSVEVTMPLTAPDDLNIVSEDGCLKINIRHSRVRFNGKSVFIKIKAPIVYEYEVNGSAQIVVNHEVNTGERAFAVEINGSGSVSVAQVVAPEFKAEVNGSGKVNFASVAASESARLVVNGSGKANVTNMASKYARLKVNGSGRLNVERLATPQLKASLAGSGRMQVKGVADKAKFEITGSGTIDATELKTRDKNSRTSGSGRILLL
jgi:hypothetical protein